MNTEHNDESENQPTSAQLALRLYVAGNAPNSVAATANLKAICNRCLEPDAYDLEIIDVLEEPSRALEDHILVTPTLLRVAPRPVTIVGTLSDHRQVLQALGVERRAGNPAGRPEDC